MHRDSAHAFVLCPAPVLRSISAAARGHHRSCSLARLSCATRHAACHSLSGDVQGAAISLPVFDTAFNGLQMISGPPVSHQQAASLEPVRSEPKAKRCERCTRVYQLRFFPTMASQPDGLRPQCCGCMHELRLEAKPPRQ